MREIIARQFQGFDLQSKEGDGNSKKELPVLPTPLNRHAENPALGGCHREAPIRADLRGRNARRHFPPCQ